MISKPSDPAILFDLDGTLIDTTYRHVTSWAVALRDAGILVPEWKIHRRIGMSGRSLVRQLVREHGLRSPEIDVEQLEKAHDAVFNKSISSIRPLPGAGNCSGILRSMVWDGLLQQPAEDNKRQSCYGRCEFPLRPLSLPAMMLPRPSHLPMYSS